MPCVFKDFLDQRRRNVIREWLDSLPVKPRQKIDAVLRHLSVQPTLKGQRIVKKIHGHDAVLEIVVESFGVQYRPLGGYGPKQGEFSIVIGAIEQNNRIQPPDAFATADERVAAVNSGEAQVCNHVYENSAPIPPGGSSG